jgi:hypothetical protein
MKKLLEYSEWLKQEVLLNVQHRHWVFTIPKELRCYFFDKRYLCNKLIETACQFTLFIYRKFSNLSEQEKQKAHPGIVGVLQTANSNLTFNPHVHIISTEGLLIEQDGDDIYIPVSFLPYDYIRIAWRNRVLNMLYNFKIISNEERKCLKKDYAKGFNVNGVIKDTINDYEVKERLCQYMMRGLISERNILYYNQDKEIVVIRHKWNGHYTTERMSVPEFIARVVQHIDPVIWHTRYYGVYSNRIRHRRKKAGKKANSESKNIYRAKVNLESLGDRPINLH